MNDLLEEIEIATEMAMFKGLKLKSTILFHNIKLCLIEEDPIKKKELKRKIREYIYDIFTKSIDSESSKELYFCSSNINWDRHEVQKKDSSWHVENDGIYKYINGDFDTYVDMIPRSHEKGFYLEDDASEDAKNYILNNDVLINSINRYMTRKEEVISNTYEPKSYVTREFTEKLIDYLGFYRISDLKTIETNRKR